MAQSRLDPDVVYPVHRDLEPEDREFDAWVYETSIGGHSKTVAVGQPRTTFQEQGIVHYPVYLVRDGTVDGQIGVYEVRDELVPHVLDEEGAVQPDLMGEPLLYPAPESANETRSPVAQTKEEDAKIRKAYRTKRGAPWIQKFMRNPAYGLVDNEAGGDDVRDAAKLLTLLSYHNGSQCTLFAPFFIFFTKSCTICEHGLSTLDPSRSLISDRRETALTRMLSLDPSVGPLYGLPCVAI